MNMDSQLNQVQVDALKEAGTIGAGHSADALSQLLSTKITIAVPDVKVIPLEGIIDMWKPPESMVVVIYMNLMGETRGKSFLMFPRKSAFALLDLLMKRPVGETKVLREMDYSGLKEMGNILSGAFVTALSTFLNIMLIPSVPLLAYDMAGAILESFAIEFGLESDEIFCIQAAFTEQEQGIEGDFVFLFNCQSFNMIIDSLETKIKKMTARKGSR